MSKSVIDQLAADTAPKNFSEFELGLVLIALYNELSQKEKDRDPVVISNMMNKVPDVVEYWREKYGEEIDDLGTQASQSAGNRE